MKMLSNTRIFTTFILQVEKSNPEYEEYIMAFIDRHPAAINWIKGKIFGLNCVSINYSVLKREVYSLLHDLTFPFLKHSFSVGCRAHGALDN